MQRVAEIAGVNELRVIPAVAGKHRHGWLVAGLGVDDIELLQFDLLAQRREFRPARERLLDGFGQIGVIWRGFERVGQIQGNIFPDVARQIVAEQIREIILGDAILVFGADQIGPLVGHGHFGAQHVEFWHGAGIEAMLLVFEFLLQQIDRGFVNGDLLGRQQRVVIRQPHREQRVGHGGLVLRERLLFGGVAALMAAPAFRLRKWTARFGCRRSNFDWGSGTDAGNFSIASGSVYLYWPLATNCGSATARVCTTTPCEASRSFLALKIVAFCRSAMLTHPPVTAVAPATRWNWCRSRQPRSCWRQNPSRRSTR